MKFILLSEMLAMICVTTASSLVQMSHTKGCFVKKKPGLLQFGFADILFVTIAAVIFFAAQALICGLLKINVYICAVFHWKTVVFFSWI